MALTTEQRNALGDHEFAVPGKRKLPIHDERHVRLAWSMVDQTQGLSDEERHEARRRILKRAKELGIDTADWSKIKAMSMDVSLEAMSLEMPAGDHPNKMPFSGCLVWLDEPSDKPPHGSGGRLVVMTHAAAEKAIPTLLGMGVNFTEKLDGHDPQKKIGIISEANIRTVGDRTGIFIDGFIYASDFPNTAARIRADKSVLGFSFEAQSIKLADPGAAILAIDECVFTGAAILRKDKAAFSTTTLAAQAEGQPEEFEMDKEELKGILAEAMKPISDRLTKVEEAAAKTPQQIAAASTLAALEPHAKALDACADGMEAAGIGNHPLRGHVALARGMAKHLRASAAMGQIPHIYRDHDFFSAASDDTKTGTEAISAAVEAALKPLKDELSATQTQLKDLKAAGFNAAAAPDRKTISPEITQLLAKGGITANENTKLTVSQVDDLLGKAGVTGSRAIEAKIHLQAAGMIAAA